MTIPQAFGTGVSWTAGDLAKYLLLAASLRVVPVDRLLMETDHPFGDRSEAQPRRPGNVMKPEKVVATVFGVSPDALRLQTWRNLRAMAEKASLIEMFPREFQVQFLAS